MFMSARSLPLAAVLSALAVFSAAFWLSPLHPASIPVSIMPLIRAANTLFLLCLI